MKKFAIAIKWSKKVAKSPLRDSDMAKNWPEKMVKNTVFRPKIGVFEVFLVDFGYICEVLVNWPLFYNYLQKCKKFALAISL